MKLNLSERFTVLSVLPEQGNFATLKIIRDLQEQLSLDEQEWKSYGVTQKGPNISWDPKFAQIEKDIKIGNKAHSIIREALEKLDKEEKLEVRHYTVFEKFVKND